jgi:hypothetical protein
LDRRFWIVRTVKVFSGVFLLLALGGLLKGRPPVEASVFAAGWSAVSTAIFIVSRYHQARRGQACALCRDTPEDVARP